MILHRSQAITVIAIDFRWLCHIILIAMNRRSFMSTVGALLGVGTTCYSESINEAMSRETYNGPFCVEVYSPRDKRDRLLPIFDNIV